jgi:potassium-transporting ATPase ATP-binding subunit
VQYKSLSAVSLLRRHLLIYGIGGLVSPFIGIKAIDSILAAAGIV